MEEMEECSSDVAAANEKHSVKTNRVIVCIGLIVGSIWTGMAEDCAGAVSANLDEPISEDRATHHLQVWTAPFGIAGSYLLMRWWGRKPALLIANTVSVVGCVCLLFTRHKETALVGCVLIWFSSTAYVTAARVFASEVTGPQLRAPLAVLICLAAVFGSVLNLLFRMLAKGRHGVRACFSVSLMALILTSYVHESPYWLHLQRRSDKAAKVFRWIRGEDAKSGAELRELLATRVDPAADRVLTKRFVNAVLIVLAMMQVKRASGLDVLRPLQDRILQETFSLEDTSTVGKILFDLLRICSSAALCLLILGLRRRTLFFVSAAGTLISMLIWSCVKSFDPALESRLLPLLVFHNISAFLGIIQIPWILATEIFANHSRDAGLCSSTLLFVLLKIISSEEEKVFNYWLHWALMLINVVIAFYIMPETKGITLQEAEKKIPNKLFKRF